MFTITGIIVILCVYQMFKIGRSIYKISTKVKSDFRMTTLREELDRLNNQEFVEWCVDYLKTKKYNYVSTLDENTLICNVDGEKIYVNCVKAGDLDKKSLFKLLGLKGINRINKLAVLSNVSEPIVDKELLEDFQELGVELIGIGEFEISYEEYVRKNQSFA